MTSLQLAFKARLNKDITNRPAQFYRQCIRELPRVLMMYDVCQISEKEARQGIKNHIYAHAHVKDVRIQQHLVNYGYYELEETLLLHKQKHHLLALLERRVDTPTLSKRLEPGVDNDLIDRDIQKMIGE